MKCKRISQFTPALLMIAGLGCAQQDATTSEPNEQPAAPDLLEDADDSLTNEVDQSASGARKGAGGINGDGDYCDNGNCVAMDGDCDSNAQCATDGSICLTDNGGRYAGYPGGTVPPRNNQQDDHCAPAFCNNKQLDPPAEIATDCGGPCGNCDPALVPVGAATACELPNHHNDKCTYHCQCIAAFGDCDADWDCMGWEQNQPPAVNPNGLVCIADVGNRFGGPPTSDYCLPQHCRNRIQDGDENLGIDAGGSCGGPNCAAQALVIGTECTPSCPCAAGAGDCDTNLDCTPGNVCAEEGAVDRCRPLPGSFKRVFVTSTLYTGNLGGLAGADAKCQARAAAAGLPGVYRAWLSAGGQSPLSRFTQSAVPYQRVDGVQVAASWADLIDGTLAAPINVTELGGPAPIGNTSCGGGGFPTVWSNSGSSGGPQQDVCGGWTNESGGSLWGNASFTNTFWSSWCSGGICSWTSPIYCFEQ